VRRDFRVSVSPLLRTDRWTAMSGGCGEDAAASLRLLADVEDPVVEVEIRSDQRRPAISPRRRPMAMARTRAAWSGSLREAARKSSVSSRVQGFNHLPGPCVGPGKQCHS